MSWILRTDPSGFATRWSDDAAAHYRAAGYWRDETLADVARRTCREAPDQLLLDLPLPEPAGDHLQHLVAGRVAERLVDLAQAVDVQEHQADRRVRSAAAQFGIAAGEQRGAVREPGQRIVDRVVRGTRRHGAQRPVGGGVVERRSRRVGERRERVLVGLGEVGRAAVPQLQIAQVRVADGEAPGDDVGLGARRRRVGGAVERRRYVDESHLGGPAAEQVAGAGPVDAPAALRAQ